MQLADMHAPQRRGYDKIHRTVSVKHCISAVSRPNAPNVYIPFAFYERPDGVRPEELMARTEDSAYARGSQTLTRFQICEDKCAELGAVAQLRGMYCLLAAADIGSPRRTSSWYALFLV